MAEAAVWFFYVHTAICATFLCMAASWLWSRLRGEGLVALVPVALCLGKSRSSGRQLFGDEAFMHGAGYAILGLYLFYAEIYLYRVYSFIQF